MRALFVSIGLLFLMVVPSKAQNPERFFPASDLMEVGVYYYPEHWDESQWTRDFKHIRSLGFDFVHFAEFAWAQLEPNEGQYTFEWLDRAVAGAAAEGLKVILCTSTATPPVWLVRKHPEIGILLEDHTRMAHGARQHPSYSNAFYRSYSLKMIEKLAQRYGQNPHVMGWQLDNEPKVSSDFNTEAQERFRVWVKKKYQTIEAVNKAWGTSFWGQVYSDFSQIEIPQASQLFMNNHQVLDHKRFTAEETASFLDEQAETIRRNVSPKQWITTNYIPAYDDGHLRQSPKLDFHSYTRYMVYGENFGLGRKGYRVGPVERIALANDFFRPIDNLYGVMELQPGQVNWGQINPQPLPGAVRLWMWHVFAGGSKFICTYRYRQPLYGTELYHYGIVGSDGVTTTPGGLEYAQVIKEIQTLRKEYSPNAKPNAEYEARRTAMLYNHENTWEMERGKQTTQWNSLNHFSKYYDALKRFNAPVDVIEETADFSKYKVLVAPSYQLVDRGLVAKLTNYVQQGGNLVMSCRTGHKNRNGQLFEMPYAAMIYPLIGAEIPFYDHLLPHTPDSVRFDGKPYAWVSWGENLKPQANTETWATYEGDFYAGNAAISFYKLGKGTVTYVGVDSKNGDLERDVLKKLYTKLNIPLLELPEGVHIEYRDGFGIAVNYSPETATLPLPEKTKYLIGNKTIPTTGVAVFKY